MVTWPASRPEVRAADRGEWARVVAHGLNRNAGFRHPRAMQSAHTSPLLFRAENARLALIWLPALGVPARKYQRFAEALAAQGISSLLHEWRGTGAHAARASRSVDWGYRELLEVDIPESAAALRAAHPDVPLVFAGHSIGGQFAALAAALDGDAAGVVPVASGVPNWRLFPSPLKWVIAGFGHALPPITHTVGHYPGEWFRFAGREAGQLMRDWSGTVRRGHYNALKGLPSDFDTRLAALRLPVLGLRFDRDSLVPAASLEALVGALGGQRKEIRSFDAEALGVPANHFAWMRQPERVAEAVGTWWTQGAR